MYSSICLRRLCHDWCGRGDISEYLEASAAHSSASANIGQEMDCADSDWTEQKTNRNIVDSTKDVFSRKIFSEKLSRSELERW